MKRLLLAAALLSTPALADAPESFYAAVKVKLKTEDGKDFKLKTSRIMKQGERIILGGANDVTVEAQYDPLGENMLMSFFVVDEDQKPLHFGKVLIGQNDGAKLEVGDFRIEFWDVTKKRPRSSASDGSSRNAP